MNLIVDICLTPTAQQYKANATRAASESDHDRLLTPTPDLAFSRFPEMYLARSHLARPQDIPRCSTPRPNSVTLTLPGSRGPLTSPPRCSITVITLPLRLQKSLQIVNCKWSLTRYILQLLTRSPPSRSRPFGCFRCHLASRISD